MKTIKRKGRARLAKQLGVKSKELKNLVAVTVENPDGSVDDVNVYATMKARRLV